jgi:hypothetical protein
VSRGSTGWTRDTATPPPRRCTPFMVPPGFKDTSMVTVTIIDREGREIQAAAPTA